MTPAVFRTAEYHNYGIEFSPFVDGLAAIASSQYFGIVGNGKQFVVKALDNGEIGLVRAFETQDGLFDCCWNELNENQLLSASGDGSIKLWDIQTKDSFPIRNFHEHQQEVASVDWNLVSKDMFASSSWDRTVKIWSPHSLQSIRTFTEYMASVYNARWSPRNPKTLVTCSADHMVKVLDINSPQSVVSIRAHEGEVLAVDWNKYNEFVVASGSVDRTIRTWDIRRPIKPLSILAGHQYAVRRLKCSPHDENIIGSVSYDMTACFWNTQKEDALIGRFEHHSEFTMGIDFSLFRRGQVATCSWDEHICFFEFDSPIHPPRIPPPPRKPGSRPPIQ